MECKSDCVFNIDGKCTRQSKKDITVTEKWKNDFKGFISRLSMPEDDFYGIMQYIDEVPNEERWIPVSERLPKENESVIASTEYGVYPEARYTEEYGWEWAYEAGADYWKEIDSCVTAWMPLPKPYEP